MYDDETLMAYADDELDAARRAEIAAAIDRDPELAGRVEKFRALRTKVAGALSGVLDQPVPDRLRAAAGARPTARPPTGNVVKFPSRGTHAPATPWRTREWTAMAASLVLGVLLSWRFLPPGVGDLAPSDGSMLAQGELAKALSTRLASDQPADAAVFIGVTFKTDAGSYCRSFILRASAIAGVACRGADQWRISVMQAVEVPAGDLRQAAAAMPPAIVSAIETRMRGDALDAGQERAGLDAGWE